MSLPLHLSHRLASSSAVCVAVDAWLLPSPSPSLCSAGSPQSVFPYLLQYVYPGLGLLGLHPALFPCLSV